MIRVNLIHARCERCRHRIADHLKFNVDGTLMLLDPVLGGVALDDPPRGRDKPGPGICGRCRLPAKCIELTDGTIEFVHPVSVALMSMD